MSTQVSITNTFVLFTASSLQENYGTWLLTFDLLYTVDQVKPWYWYANAKPLTIF